MKIKDTQITLTGIDGSVTIKRMQGGFPRIEADAQIDLHYGLGYIHVYDRQIQMWLLKILGHGRGSELLSGDEELIEIDKFKRLKFGWLHRTVFVPHRRHCRLNLSIA